MDSPHFPRSLNLPRRSISPERSPTRTTQDKLSTRVYAQYPGLDRVMLSYLDMDGILELYAQNHETFETREALAVLTQRFNLPGHPRTFRSLLKRYDQEYATVRSYNRIEKSLTYDEHVQEAEYILLKAARQGNIQAVINGFKLYPDLLNLTMLNAVLEQAAHGGHEPVIDLLLDLGATIVNDRIIAGALAGGHLNLITGDKYKGIQKPINRRFMYTSLVFITIANQQLPALQYLFSLPNYKASMLNDFMRPAGEAGSQSVVEYLITQGANNYTDLVIGAMRRQHYDLAVKYLDEVDTGRQHLQDEIKHTIYQVITGDRLDILKLLVKHKLVNRKLLAKLYTYASKINLNQDIIAYLKLVSD
jgi:hypothetical protein